MTDSPISPLVADLIGANMDALNRTTNTLIDNLTEQVETANATLDAIRDNVTELLSGDYMPSPKALMVALWPSDAEVDLFRPAGES